MVIKSFLSKVTLLVFSCFLLANCTKVNENRLPVTRQQASSPYTMPADAYLAMAQNQVGEEKQNMLLMAAGRSIYDGQWRKATQILSQTEDLSPAQINEKAILLAKVDMINEQPRSAINKLAQVRGSNQLPAFYQMQYHEVLAGAYEATGQTSYGVTERIRLDHLLNDDAVRANNRRILWLNLTKLPVAELNTIAVEAKDGSELQGWMQLALIPRQNATNAPSLIAGIEQWQQRYPQHPGNSLLPTPLSSVKPYLARTPRQVALLLPMSGALAGPGTAVKDGFVAARDADTSGRKLTVRVYDTASHDAAAAYQQALADGADYVVGPLTKTDVAKVAALDHPVPTLLLNDMDGGSSDNAYQFGLSPGNEARQVAVKASKKGLRRVLIIAPSGTWGDEVVAAFSNQWQSSGGQVVERLSYDNNTDLSVAVRDFLHVTEKEALEKQVKPVDNEPVAVKRRQDFDMIFLLAYPSKARQIMPMLKYYFAGDVPVYATSSVYAGNTNTMRDRDLDGIIFCDMPWVFAHQLANKNWPEQFNSYNRLYAMGLDSYALGTQLNQLLLFPAMGVNDKSGVLYLNRARQVARILAWGRFRGGVAQLTSEIS